MTNATSGHRTGRWYRWDEEDVCEEGKRKTNTRYLEPVTVVRPMRANRIMKTISFLPSPHNSLTLCSCSLFPTKSLPRFHSSSKRVNSGALHLISGKISLKPFPQHSWLEAPLHAPNILSAFCHTSQLLDILNNIPHQSS